MSKFAPVYLFTGPERGEKDRTISEIIKRYTSETGLEPEIYKFYPFEISLSEIIALLKNGGLFSEYKFVFLMNTDELKKNEIPLLVSYLKNPGKDSTLFLLSDSIQIDRKISSAVKKKISESSGNSFKIKKSTGYNHTFVKIRCKSRMMPLI